MKSSSTAWPGRAGFTLMEMLVVISIIVVLAGLTIGGLGFVKDKQAREQAKVQINLLQMALQEYHSDNGFFPEGANPSGENATEEIYKALYPQDRDEEVYLTQLNPENDTFGWLKGQTGETGETGLKIYDPWGNEYRYRANDPSAGSSSIAANPDFDLWSAGPDGRTNPGSAGNYDNKAPENLDDIRGW